MAVTGAAGMRRGVRLASIELLERFCNNWKQARTLGGILALVERYIQWQQECLQIVALCQRRHVACLLRFRACHEAGKPGFPPGCRQGVAACQLEYRRHQTLAFPELVEVGKVGTGRQHLYCKRCQYDLVLSLAQGGMKRQPSASI